MPSNTPETQALLPVTQADRDAAAEIAETLLINSDLFPALIRNGEHDAHPFVQSYARHNQRGSNADGVDPSSTPTQPKAPRYETAAEITRRLTDEKTAPLRNAVSRRRNAEPMGEETVDGLEWTDDGYSLRTPYDGDADGDGRPIIVGGEIVVTFSDSDEGDKYRERILRALTTPPTPHEFVKNPLIPFPSCQVCMGPENAEAHSPPTPDRTPAQEGEGERCQKCGRGNPSWSTPSPLWNAVIRGGSIDGEPLFGDMVCASCFMEMAEQAGIASNWRVDAQRVNVPLETTTPTGRVWDAGQWLWVHPDEASPQPVDETERLRSRVAKATAILEQARDGSAGYRQARIIAALSALQHKGEVSRG